MISEWVVIVTGRFKKLQGGSSLSMISQWGVTPFCDRMVKKIRGGSSLTMILEWGVTPPSATGWLKTRWFISHYDFGMGCDPPSKKFIP